jgi:phosphomannomutase/phosphoglucomutase
MTRLFGTNGIRGIVNQEMNGTLALGIGQAWGTYLKQTIARPRVALGTDARLSNHMLKHAISAGLLSTGCDVVDIGLVPTPALQYTVKEKEYHSGVVITASHNPPEFNGIKGIDGDGTEFSKNTEEKIEAIYFSNSFQLATWQEVGNYSIWDGALDLYQQGILNVVDIERIRHRKLHVVLDCGHGAGSVVTPHLLRNLGCMVTELFCTPDGLFPGRPSEPLPENLEKLMQTVVEVGADFGVAQDGDADRAIFIDEKGRYLWGDQTLCLVANAILEQHPKAIAVTPVTSSTAFDKVAQKHDGTVIRTRVGSPIVARVMMKHHAIFGGEENGGLIFPELQYCRDSAMTIAKVLEIISKEDRSLSSLVEELPQYENVKTKFHCPNDKKTILIDTLVQEIKEDSEVVSVDTTDGLKLFMSDGWVLLRPSGTEPIFRVYAESKSKQRAQDLVKRYKRLTESLLQRL